MPDDPPPLDANFIKKYEDLIAENQQRQKEAGQEFDKQAVYIAGGGLALTLSVAKDFTDFVGKQYFVLLLLTWLLFALTLLFNLISHRASSLMHAAQANLASHYQTTYQARQPFDVAVVETETNDAERNSRWVRRLNKFALYTISAAMVNLILYVFLNAAFMPTKPVNSDQSTKPGPKPDSTRGLESPTSLRPLPPPVVQPTIQPATTQPSPAKSND